MNARFATGDTHFNTHRGAARHASTLRARPVAWAEIAALILITVALIAATMITSGAAHSSVPSERVRVEAGQTLWTLASQHPVAGVSTEQAAQLIAGLNHIEDGRLSVGTTIRIPGHAEQNLAVACR